VRIFVPVVFLLVIFLGSCSQKLVCPAYQSAFIFDTAALKRQFSYFKNDTPKIYEVNQNKFLLAEPVSYRKKMAGFRTIEMLPIYPVIPDSLQFVGDEEMKNEMDVQDSTSTAAVEEKAPLHPGLIGSKFNVEQEMYMYYFRKTLVLPDVRGQMAKPEKKGFFKRLKDKIKNIFKRKKKKKDKAAETEDVDTTQEPKKEKGGLFDKFKRKKQAEVDPDTEPETVPDTNNPDINN